MEAPARAAARPVMPAPIGRVAPVRAAQEPTAVVTSRRAARVPVARWAARVPVAHLAAPVGPARRRAARVRVVHRPVVPAVPGPAVWAPVARVAATAAVAASPQLRVADPWPR